MRFRNKETGEIYNQWCDVPCSNECKKCPVPNYWNGHDCGCFEFSEKYPIEAAELLGCEAIQNNTPSAEVPNHETIKIKLDENAIMPTRAHDIDAGLDLYATYTQIVPGFGSAVFDTGVHVEIPVGYAGMVKSKSGLNVKHNLTSEGVVDAGYTGSIIVKLYNHGETAYIVHRGDKISQLVIVPVITPKLEVVDELEETERGNRRIWKHWEIRRKIMNEWISVKDRMPESHYGESDNVLVIDEIGIRKILYFDGGCWCYPTGETYGRNVTHWMPLPELPKEENPCSKTE